MLYIYRKLSLECKPIRISITNDMKVHNGLYEMDLLRSMVNTNEKRKQKKRKKKKK